jgi:hypothetical protein
MCDSIFLLTVTEPHFNSGFIELSATRIDSRASRDHRNGGTGRKGLQWGATPAQSEGI